MFYPNNLTFISFSRSFALLSIIFQLVVTVLGATDIAKLVVCRRLARDQRVSRRRGILSSNLSDSLLVVVRLCSRHPFIAVLQSKWAAEYHLIEGVLLIKSAYYDPLPVLAVELPQDLLPACHKIESSIKLLDRLLLAGPARSHQTLKRQEVGYNKEDLVVIHDYFTLGQESIETEDLGELVVHASDGVAHDII